MLKIFTNEGECVVVLTNVEMMGEFDFVEKMFGELSDEEGEIVENFTMEGNVVKEDDEIENLEVKEMTFEEYIGELKEVCKLILEDE